jgi:hypothetical protein
MRIKILSSEVVGRSRQNRVRFHMRKNSLYHGSLAGGFVSVRFDHPQLFIAVRPLLSCRLGY